VILFTLVGQGLTLAPLLCRLGLASEGRDHREELEARRATVRARLARVGHWVATERKTGFVKDAKGDGCSRSIPPNSAVTSSSPAVFSRHGQRTIVLAQNGSSEMSRRSLTVSVPWGARLPLWSRQFTGIRRDRSSDGGGDRMTPKGRR